MELKSWLKLERGRARKLALHMNVPPSFITKITNGEKHVPAERCRTIVDFTNGAVTVQELLPNDWQKYWPELAVSPVDGAGVAAENVAQEA